MLNLNVKVSETFIFQLRWSEEPAQIRNIETKLRHNPS